MADCVDVLGWSMERMEVSLPWCLLAVSILQIVWRSLQHPMCQSCVGALILLRLVFEGILKLCNLVLLPSLCESF